MPPPPPAAPLHRRPPPLALVLLVVLGCAAGLATGPRRTTGALPLRADEVIARRAPSFGLIPISRRDDAVLRSQPDLQILGAGTTLTRAKLARLQGERARRLSALAAGVTGRAGGDQPEAGRAGAGATRLRAPPSPA